LNAWHRQQLIGPSEPPTFDPALFVARAKAERESDPALLANWLTPEEKRAFLHDPALVAGLIAPEPQLLQA